MLSARKQEIQLSRVRPSFEALTLHNVAFPLWMLPMELWQSLLLAAGGNATLLLVLGYFGKLFFDKLIARDAKAAEAAIQARAAEAIERLKTDLQLRTIEHQVRFSRLHEKRAEVIAELYALLVEALWAAESFLSPITWAGDPPKNKQASAAQNKLVDFFGSLTKAASICLRKFVRCSSNTQSKCVNTSSISLFMLTSAKTSSMTIRESVAKRHGTRGGKPSRATYRPLARSWKSSSERSWDLLH